MTSKELPWDRLATSDAHGNRIYLYPPDVPRGRWKKIRGHLSIALIAIFLGLPWVRISGHQALLLDIPHRRFAILGLTFWAHDAPLLFFLVIGAVILIAFVTAIWGRVWCGWACPQTVFGEQVFRKIERWLEGDRNSRRRLDQSPMSLNKGMRKAAKWGVFTFLALVLSHSFLAYFVGTEALGRMMTESPAENSAEFMVMASVAVAILFDFGWFREQFCTVLCPYGRFQSVLMDAQSTVVAYDVKRGEPRRGVTADRSPVGDCVNCYRCVQVCPTGIDIRRGVQLECIACTACMDTCDDVMSRLKKPLGLIRYGNQAMTEGKHETLIPWLRRPRAWIYLVLLVACVGGLALTISARTPIEFELVRAVDSPYQEFIGAQGQPLVLNHFKMDLRNQTFEDQKISLQLGPTLQALGVSLVLSNHGERISAGESERADLFIQFQKSLLHHGHTTIPIQLIATSFALPGLIQLEEEAHLVGPLR